MRGQLIRLSDSLDAILTRHNYPQNVSVLLAQTIGLSSLFGSRLKFDGKVSVQAQSEGAVRLLVADCEHDGAVRGFAQFDETLCTNADIQNESDLLGRGHLAITIDPGTAKDRYQGIVELSERGVIASTLSYFSKSEQTLTNLKLFASAPSSSASSWSLGGVMIQKLPPPEERHLEPTHQALDDWEAASALLDTMGADELLDPHVDSHALLFRLYHEMGVRVYDPSPVRFGCSCTRERIENILRTFSAEDIQDIVEDEGQVRANCEFCNETYLFSLTDLDVMGIRPDTLNN